MRAQSGARTAPPRIARGQARRRAHAIRAKQGPPQPGRRRKQTWNGKEKAPCPGRGEEDTGANPGGPAECERAAAPLPAWRRGLPDTPQSAMPGQRAAYKTNAWETGRNMTFHDTPGLPPAGGAAPFLRDSRSRSRRFRAGTGRRSGVAGGPILLAAEQALQGIEIMRAPGAGCYARSQREPLSVSVSGSLEEQVARLEAKNAALRAQDARLVERIAVLERRPGLKGRNSGRPPSGEGLAKPAVMRRTQGLRERPGRKPGREGETLRRAARPDRVEDHIPMCCRGLGGVLVGRSGCAPAGRPSNAPPFGGGGASGSRAALRSLRDGGAGGGPGRRVGPGAIGSASCGGGGVRPGCGASAAGGRPCPGACGQPGACEATG